MSNEHESETFHHLGNYDRPTNLPTNKQAFNLHLEEQFLVCFDQISKKINFDA